MIPLYKLLSLVLRVFSRPLINLTKRYHANNHIRSSWLRNRFSALGLCFHRLENRINRRYLKMDPNTTSKTLSQSQAVDKGIQFFYEILFYSIALGFPFYELYRQVVDTKAKEAKLSARVKKIQGKIEQIQCKSLSICSKLSDSYSQIRTLSEALSLKYWLFVEYIPNEQVDENVSLLRKHSKLFVDGPDLAKYRLL